MSILRSVRLAPFEWQRSRADVKGILVFFDPRVEGKSGQYSRSWDLEEIRRVKIALVSYPPSGGLAMDQIQIARDLTAPSSRVLRLLAI